MVDGGGVVLVGPMVLVDGMLELQATSLVTHKLAPVAKFLQSLKRKHSLFNSS